MAHVIKRIPEERTLTRKPIVWMEAVRDVLMLERRRADFRASVEKVVRYILNARLWDKQYLTSPSWKKADLTPYGLTRITFYRAWRWLVDSKFLGKVAHGRQHKYKPTSLKALDTEKGDDKALYVLAVPLSADDQGDALLGGVDNHVDVSETITPKGVAFVINPLDENEDAASRRLKNTSGGSAARPSRLLPPLPKVIRGDITVKRQNDKRPSVASQLEFARTLKFFLPVLNSPKLSDKYLAKLLRINKFFDADWTVNDIVYAVDIRPGNRRWAHDGAHGVKHPGGWLMHRLAAHRGPDGRPIQSRSQRLKTEQAEAKARARITAEKIAADKKQLEESILSGAAAAGIAQLRAVIRGEA